MRSISLILACFIIGLTGFCQTLVTSMNVEKQKIVIGEPFTVRIQSFVKSKQSYQTIFPDSIAHFEILERSKPDSLEQGDSLLVTEIIKLTSWDSGQWQIPSLQTGKKTFGPYTISVGFVPFDPTQDFHDIRDIMPVEKPARVVWYWYAILGALLLGIIILMFPSGKKTSAKEEPVRKTEPFGDAMHALNQLESELPVIASSKLFYSRLTDIIRNYLQQRKNIHSDSRTSREIIKALNKLPVSNAIQEQVSQILMEGDMVKFAKHQPGIEEQGEAINKSRSILKEIESSHGV